MNIKQITLGLILISGIAQKSDCADTFESVVNSLARMERITKAPESNENKIKKIETFMEKTLHEVFMMAELSENEKSPSKEFIEGFCESFFAKEIVCPADASYLKERVFVKLFLMTTILLTHGYYKNPSNPPLALNRKRILEAIHGYQVTHWLLATFGELFPQSIQMMIPIPLGCLADRAIVEAAHYIGLI